MITAIFSYWSAKETDRDCHGTIPVCLTGYAIFGEGLACATDMHGSIALSLCPLNHVTTQVCLTGYAILGKGLARATDMHGSTALLIGPLNHVTQVYIQGHRFNP